MQVGSMLMITQPNVCLLFLAVGRKRQILVWKSFSSHLEKYFLQFGRIFFFQFGGEETGAFQKAPPALIACATVAFVKLPYHCFKGELNIDWSIDQILFVKRQQSHL